jgi:hypothetical protein
MPGVEQKECHANIKHFAGNYVFCLSMRLTKLLIISLFSRKFVICADRQIALIDHNLPAD